MKAVNQIDSSSSSSSSYLVPEISNNFNAFMVIAYCDPRGLCMWVGHTFTEANPEISQISGSSSVSLSATSDSNGVTFTLLDYYIWRIYKFI